MQTSETMEAPAIIVVVLQEILVAHDIRMILREARPDARVLLAQSLCDAERALPAGRIEMAIVQMDPATIAGSSLGRRVVADGGKVVVVSADQRERLPDGWIDLPIPFASADVASLLSDPA